MSVRFFYKHKDAFAYARDVLRANRNAAWEVNPTLEYRYASEVSLPDTVEEKYVAGAKS
jgi:hypothetical protein